ncbi:glucosyl-3-phosphoglycerate synthase [Dactylosporangium sp. AC04546]|uniref:glucosyl-3-phosphoglycerate synthase n=1 Tax=Dactylosporangium sp. AC04546 TaxID=2862460 RepID=UPI001EDCAB4B|nr:glucosyl-3-phosphoglycerate synthase [Dactylosporangium sp. AC04546]WVK84394.1 glucosyl-3-phosphoglycerate synthase [Dactylosporangium sp. AC04546]
MHPSAAAWFAARTASWLDFPVAALAAQKQDTRVSVVLPALDEEPTVGDIVTGVLTLGSLVDEVVVVDSGSVDRTAEVAAAAGAVVHHRDDILAWTGSRPGKGEVLWKALAVTTGDILVYVDADLTDFRPHFVTGLLGPLFADPAVQMVKAFYDRPLLDVSAAGGGRVTELAARPLLNAHFPELAGVVQPLAGEYAARRSLLERLPFAYGYGVETGLLIDTYRTAGLDAIAQVDLGQRTHGHQDTAALGRMAATIVHTINDRVSPEHKLWPTLTQFRRHEDGVVPQVTDVSLPDRPPMVTVDGYAA